jgi:hypothetical protein
MEVAWSWRRPWRPALARVRDEWRLLSLDGREESGEACCGELGRRGEEAPSGGSRARPVLEAAARRSSARESPRRAEVHSLELGAVCVSRRRRAEAGVSGPIWASGPDLGLLGRGDLHVGWRLALARTVVCSVCSSRRGVWWPRCLAGLEVEMKVDRILGFAGCVGVVCSFLRLHRRGAVAAAVRGSRADCPMLWVFRIWSMTRTKVMPGLGWAGGDGARGCRSPPWRRRRGVSTSPYPVGVWLSSGESLDPVRIGTMAASATS